MKKEVRGKKQNGNERRGEGKTRRVGRGDGRYEGREEEDGKKKMRLGTGKESKRRD